MRVLIAPDKFKGSLTAREAAEIIRAGLAECWPDASFELCPLADGGEGTIDALLAALGGEVRRVVVPGPLGRPVEARYALLPDGRAVIESAEALSLARVAPDPLAPDRASSAGLGGLLRAVVAAGCDRILIGLGGTATLDGGAGLLTALGARLLDADGLELPPGCLPLARLDRIDVRGLEPLRHLSIEALCDVRSPLLGPAGAATVFAPQKGAGPALIPELEQALARWAAVLRRAFPEAAIDAPGDGAAGGLGFGLRVGLGATLRPGGPALMRETGLEPRLRGAALVVTGEGSIDPQTLEGKLVSTLAAAAAEAGVPLVAIGGKVEPPAAGRSWPFPVLSLCSRPAPLAVLLEETRPRLLEISRHLGAMLRIGAGLEPAGQ